MMNISVVLLIYDARDAESFKWMHIMYIMHYALCIMHYAYHVLGMMRT